MEDQLQVTKENAIKAFDATNKDGKVLLTNLFGEKVFIKNISDRIKSHDDAVEVLGKSHPVVIENTIYNTDTKYIISIKKLYIIVAALNEGWTPDWTNTSQYKWFPVFEYKSGFGFSITDFGFRGTITDVGSRLSFKSKALAEYAATQFQSIYNDYLA